jgi:iron complex transport system ATP-binding protein
MNAPGDKTGRPVLKMIDLCVGYPSPSGEVLLFRDLNLTLSSGNLVCFMGPNGAGKSTLIRTLAGLHRPLRGAVERQGIRTMQRQGIPHTVSVVLTDRVSSANLTVRELITYGRYPHLDWRLKLTARDTHLVERVIDDLNLRNLIGRKIYQLSDGQMQMAMIARALAQDTPVLLLDEPTAHLDLNNRVEIMNLLREIAHQTGKAILIATHELDLALQTADLIWLTGKQEDMITGIPEDLVLNGSFDSVFMFKGFDLRTGKMQHEPYRNTPVTLSGKGHVYLWTRNALERCGYEVTTDKQRIGIEAHDAVSWTLRSGGAVREVSTINELLSFLQTIARS